MKKNVFNSFLLALFLLMFMTGVFTSCPQPETPSPEVPPPTYTITCASIIGGTVTASATTATAGTEVLLIALAETGYRLEAYTVVGVNGNVNVTGNKFIMPASNVIVSATFTLLPIIVVSNCINGTVTVSPSSYVEPGTEVTLSNTPDDGYGLDSYTVMKASGGNVTVTDGKFIMPAENVVVTATFTNLPAVTIASGITGGTVTTSASNATPGTEITLSNTADNGYVFGSYTVTKAGGGTVTVTDGKFMMPAETVTVTATFTAINYTINIGSINNGTVTASRTTATVGTQITLSNTSNSGYELGQYTVTKAGGGTVAVTNNKFTMPAENVTVTATFNAIYTFHSIVTALPAGTDGTAGTSGTYVYFGDWPQTIKAAGVTVDWSNSITMGGNTYYKGSDGFWYAECREDAFNSDSKYSDNTTVSRWSSYSTSLFKVEPIKWRVLIDNYNSSGKKLLLAEMGLTAGVRYYNTYKTANRTLGENTIYPNNYKYSNIRAYLNGTKNQFVTDGGTATTNDVDWTGTGFLQSAFTTSAQNLIVTTTVDNSAASTNPASNATLWNNGNNSYACDDTSDKIFLLSVKELTTSSYDFYTNTYDADTNIRMTTDYAKANYAMQDGEGGIWWLRSAYYDGSSRTKSVNGEGYIISADVDDNYNAVVPALCIEF